MRGFRLIPDDTRFGFVRYQYVGYAFSAALILLTLILVPLKGLNLGIDFRGGILMEVRVPGQEADLGVMRSTLNALGLGEVALQTFGEPNDVLIRIERQAGDEEAQEAAVSQVRTVLNEQFGEVDYRRTEYVGPKVSADLLWGGAQAMIYAIIAILIYIWFRFEWQYGVGAVIALIHDTVTTIGLISLLGLEFSLSTVAAILTIIGYSLNDNVVIYDRIRENLRKYKTMPIGDLIDRSINETLPRTVMTSLTTLLALLALVLFGGPVIRDFTIAMIWGVLIGTYSTVYVATPVLMHVKLRREVTTPAAQTP
jgi:preprotein translocase subunit SecF